MTSPKKVEQFLHAVVDPENHLVKDGEEEVIKFVELWSFFSCWCVQKSLHISYFRRGEGRWRGVENYFWFSFSTEEIKFFQEFSENFRPTSNTVGNSWNLNTSTSTLRITLDFEHWKFVHSIFGNFGMIIKLILTLISKIYSKLMRKPFRLFHRCNIKKLIPWTIR